MRNTVDDTDKQNSSNHYRTDGKTRFRYAIESAARFLDSVFKLANIPLVSLHYTCISRRPQDVEVSFKTNTRGAI